MPSCQDDIIVMEYSRDRNEAAVHIMQESYIIRGRLLFLGNNYNNSLNGNNNLNNNARFVGIALAAGHPDGNISLAAFMQL